MDSQNQQQIKKDIQSLLSKKGKKSNPDAQSENLDTAEEDFSNAEGSFVKKRKAVIVANGGGTMDPPPIKEEISAEVIMYFWGLLLNYQQEKTIIHSSLLNI
ncbi:MAG: hypothetical protein ACRAVC_26160 [Trichormus sp.]